MSDPFGLYGLWKPLTRIERGGWLLCAYTRWFARSASVGQTEGRREVVLDGADIDGAEGFFCAIGEAVNGPAGYFGMSLNGLADAAVGGFGTATPWTLVIQNSERARLSLGYSESLRYLRDYYQSVSYPDLETHHQAQLELEDLAASRGPTLFTDILDLLSGRKVAVKLR